MRNKVVLIKGYAGVSKKITMGEFERINADHIVLIAALRRPQFSPEGFDDPSRVVNFPKEVLSHWRSLDREHFVIAEYANMITDRGGENIKAVEGVSLELDWFYEAVKAFHRNMKVKVVECRLILDENPCLQMTIDGQRYTMADAIERLRPNPNLG